MKKGIVGALVVVSAAAAGWVGTAWYTGGSVQARMQTLLEESNRLLTHQSAPGLFTLRLEQTEYARGLLSSRARYALVLEDASGALQGLLPLNQIAFDARIDHGPFPLGALARGVFTPQAAHSHLELAKTDASEPIFTLTNGVPLLAGDSSIGYDGRVRSNFRIAPIQYANDKFTVHFSGLQENSVIQLGQSSVQIQGQAELDLLSFGEGGTEMKLSGLRMDMDMDFGAPGTDVMLATGDFSIKAQRLEIGAAAKPSPMVLTDLGLRSSSKQAGENMLAYEAGYEIGALSVGKAALGGGAWLLKLTRLDATAMQELGQAYDRIMRGTTTHRSTASVAGELPALMQGLQKLLAAKPELGIAAPLRWATAQGQSQFTFNVALAPLSAQSMLRFGKNPQELLPQLIARLDWELRLSKPMLVDILTQLALEKGQNAQQAAAAAQAQANAAAGMATMLGILRDTGDDLVGTFEYADGAARLNGEEVPLAQLLGQLPGMLRWGRQ